MQKVDVVKEFWCDEIDGDGVISLKELEILIPKLKEKYGTEAVIWFDAGYNNVQCFIGIKKEDQ